jgi:hypothetical protein
MRATRTAATAAPTPLSMFTTVIRVEVSACHVGEGLQSTRIR